MPLALAHALSPVDSGWRPSRAATSEPHPATQFRVPGLPTRHERRASAAANGTGLAPCGLVGMPALVRLLAALLAASALLLSGGCGDDEKDASARIERLRASGNAEGLGREAASTDAAAAAEAVRALGRLGQKAWPQVEAALRDSRREVRQEAAAIYPLVAPAGDAAPEMAALVRSDPEPTVRATAVTALGHVRALDEMDAVLAALDDADPLVRQRALDAVERIMGKRYDLGQTPEERSRRAAQVRADWVAQQTFIRDYYRTRRPAAK